MSAVLALQGGPKVNICGRLLDVPTESLSSLVLLSRELAAQLKISGPASLQIADVDSVHLHTDAELACALREGRHPLQAIPTAAALRDIESRKYEVESKKEELTQFQWQIVVNQMTAFSDQISKVAGQFQAMKDSCNKSIQASKDEDHLVHEQINSTITRESKEREEGLRDLREQIDRMGQAIHSERSTRDVAVYQLQKQIEQTSMSCQQGRTEQRQELAEMSRQLQAMQHELDIEKQGNAENWHHYGSFLKAVDSRVEDHTANEASRQQRISFFESETEKLKSSVRSLEMAVASQQRVSQDDLQRSCEELHRAIRDEMVGRENHLAHLSKDLETSWQSLEARLQRAKDDASAGTTSLSERTRVIEERCCELERDIQAHRESQASKDYSMMEKVNMSVNSLDKVEMSHRTTDVILETTLAKVEDLADRMVTAEGDLRSKGHVDFWKPQMEALQRMMQKQEARLAQLEKEIQARLLREHSAPPAVSQAQGGGTQSSPGRQTLPVHHSPSLEKITAKLVDGSNKDRRFIEVCDRTSDSADGKRTTLQGTYSTTSGTVATLSPVLTPNPAGSLVSSITRMTSDSMQGSRQGFPSPRQMAPPLMSRVPVMTSLSRPVSPFLRPGSPGTARR
mmetsp:Transcript_11196/g.25098  ORF Transcript_11196/g.25098 Transcript_11196/m.25098 type:complete len:627 (-) Transcript_11196:46-1926(-)